jgi:Asp-tRNA(Asn)/Glu-tRNA(Gln) amidotransferase C subunit
MALREDRAEPPLPPDEALANAPEREGSAFVVPKVLDADEG